VLQNNVPALVIFCGNPYSAIGNSILYHVLPLLQVVFVHGAGGREDGTLSSLDPSPCFTIFYEAGFFFVFSRGHLYIYNISFDMIFLQKVKVFCLKLNFW